MESKPNGADVAGQGSDTTAVEQMLAEAAAKAKAVPERIEAIPFNTMVEPVGQLWLVEYFVPYDGITLLSGAGSAGKSYTALFLAEAISAGTDFMGRKCQQHPVLFLDREHGARSYWERVRRVGDLLSRPNVFALTRKGRKEPPSPSSMAIALKDPKLKDLVTRLQPVVFIDSLMDYEDGADENSTADMMAVMEAMRMLVSFGAPAVSAIHHVNQGGESRGSKAIKDSAGACPRFS